MSNDNDCETVSIRVTNLEMKVRGLASAAIVQADLARLQARELLSKRARCGRCRSVATKAIAFGKGPHDEFYGGSFSCAPEHDTDPAAVDLPDAAALRRLEAFLAEPCT